MRPVLTIHLVRHGETLFNRRGLVQGWVDSPLTATGLAQSRSVGRELSTRPLTGLYSSTSERAEDTAIAIGAHHPHLTVTRLKGLRELHFGDLEARPNAAFEVGRDIPAFFAEMLAGRGRGSPGGESGSAFMRRVTGALTTILAEHANGGEVVVVSHGITINAILVASGWTEPGPLANASISTIRRVADEPPAVVQVGLRQVPPAL